MPRNPRSIMAAGAVVFVLSSCMGAQHAVGVQKIDGLVGHVERVHLDAELGRERVQDAVAALRVIVRREFTGEVAEAYTAFVEAIERSEAQADALRRATAPMHARAREVHEAWTADLASFTSPTLRARSEQRRDLAAQRYVEVAFAMQPVIDGLDQFNKVLRDHALFLSYDMNASAVAEVEPELEVLRSHAVVLDERVDALLRAAGDFVRTTAPVGQVHLTGEATR